MPAWIKRMLCNHDYNFVKAHEHTQQNLWRCKRCKLYYVQHYGLGIGYAAKSNKEIMDATQLFDIKE